MKAKHTVLWCLEFPGSEIRSYLMGTMHAKSDEAYTHLNLATTYLNKCQLFAGEIDLSNTNYSNNEFYLPVDITLSDLLGSKKYLKYSKIIKKAFEVDLNLLQKYKPLVAQNIILEKIITESNTLSLDFKLHDLAYKSGMKLTGIETLEEQNNILKIIPIPHQLKMFKDSFSKIKRMKRSLEKTISLYASGNINALYKESKRGLGKIRKIMLFDRNKIMAERIVELIRNESCFVAIGAAHLGGNKGVLKYLKDSSIMITAVL